MNLKIVNDLKAPPCQYAAAELWRCLLRMDPTLVEGEGGLCLSLSLLEGDPQSDRIEISVQNGVGTVAGVCPRAVLIAVYRFLYELGCRWTCPDEAGEHIPCRVLIPEEINVRVAETPTCRYRGVCMEGGVSEKNVLDMIAYLPRIGLTTYFIQLFRPASFFQNWRTNRANPDYGKGPHSNEELDAIHGRLAEEIRRRGLLHHAIGHGWTCEPFGVAGDGWDCRDIDTLPSDYRDALAVIGGEKKLYKGAPLMSNLCYGREDVRRRLVTAVAEYCEAHPHVAAVHFWLSDESNNFCECELCRDKRPADQYVTVLNELDAELTERGLPHKIVFLAYLDLVFPPLHKRLLNPDRFVLMMAPLSRSYSSSFADCIDAAKEIPPLSFARNKTPIAKSKEDLDKPHLPYGVAENLACLREWKRCFLGDGFLFDYYLIWDHVKDPGYMDISRLMFRDMQVLRDIGLAGTVNCQISRCAFPIALPMYGMAKALWSRESDFDEVADEYFTAEFGEEGGDVRAYLTELTRLFDPAYLRGERPRISPELAKAYDKIGGVIGTFRASHPALRADSEVMAWRVLAIHAELMTLLAMLLSRRARGIPHEDVAELIRTFVVRTELSVQSRFDGRNYVVQLIDRFLK